MEFFGTYLLKASAVLALFWAVYRWILQPETFFKLNRLFLLLGILGCFAIPLAEITRTITLAPAAEALLPLATQQGPQTHFEGSASWPWIVLVIYLLGVAIMAVRLVLQLISLQKHFSLQTEMDKHGIRYVRSTHITSPFSFFNRIFYNPDLLEGKDLEMVLKHEHVHVRQFHSLDNLLGELLLMAFWFNPLAWWYRKSIKENLEFLADAGAQTDTTLHKQYQYTLLKQSFEGEIPSLANPFHTSLIKKRIVMLNKKQSRKINRFKVLAVVPLLALFLASFNVRTVYKQQSTNTMLQVKQGETIEYTITKNTSDRELEKIKKELKDKDIDFSYTVAHNGSDEIIGLTLDLRAKRDKRTVTTSFNTDSDEPIETVIVRIEPDLKFYVGSPSQQQNVRVVNMNNDRNVSVSTNVSTSNSNEVSISGNTNVNVSGHSNSGIVIRSSDGTSPLYILDGKEITNEELQKIDPENISSMNVLKGDSAIEKYGKKGKQGVVEITSKP